MAALFCLAALWVGWQTVQGLNWPREPDLVRDIAQAQTAADGQPFADPFYRGEATWYPPLVPALVAAVSRITGAGVPAVHTRSGAWLGRGA